MVARRWDRKLEGRSAHQYAGGRPQTFTLPKRQEIKRIALTDPQNLDQPFATWSLSKLADYLVAEGVVTDISHEGLRLLLREEGVRFQAVRTWKRSNDPNFEPKRDRIVELYALADASQAVVICLDEFGPLNLQPQPGGYSWAPRAKPRRIRATYNRPHGVRHPPRVPQGSQVTMTRDARAHRGKRGVGGTAHRGSSLRHRCRRRTTGAETRAAARWDLYAVHIEFIMADKENMPAPTNLPEPDRSRLSRSPLELVVCAVRHERRLVVGEGSTAIAIHEALGGASGNYPELDEITGQEVSFIMAPGSGPQVSETKTSGWRFAAADGSWAVSLTAEHFSLETNAYTTWEEDFAPRLSELITAVAEIVQPAIEQRIGLRYIDRIAELELPDVASWRPYLRPEVLGLIAHPELGDLVRTAQQHLVLEFGEGLRAGVRHGPIPTKTNVDYQLDYDVFRQGARPFDVGQLVETAATLNTLALQLFQSTITDELLEKLK